MKLGAVIALLIGLALAWAGMAQEHSGPPGRSPEEECRRTCHSNHCSEWTACYSSAEDTKVCQLKVTEKELQCMRSCEPPRG